MLQVWSGVASGDITAVEQAYLGGLSIDFGLGALGPHKKPRHDLSQKTPLHLVRATAHPSVSRLCALVCALLVCSILVCALLALGGMRARVFTGGIEKGAYLSAPTCHHRPARLTPCLPHALLA